MTKCLRGIVLTLSLCFFVTLLPLNLFAEELPSVFRGVTVGEGSPGVTVVFLTEDAFALKAGLRAGDHITAVDEQPVHGLDDFAAISRNFSGKTTEVEVTVLRGSARFTTEISLVSPTVQSAWGLRFVPDYSLRFVDANAGRRYWSGRAAQELVAGHDMEAIGSLLNVLHYAPEAYDEALALCEAVLRRGERLWREDQRAEAVGVLQQAMALCSKASSKPLTVAQWRRLKQGLERLAKALAKTET